ncbi:hypothetical protein NERG_02488 [Nematocida ausubeli]|uniref:Uncharacterized protein n=1 Tax=Nematocida ausubeli (strain ATCC PRA-371 / ERTm2) TaxID=1913371 RepID=H8ZFW7_NEMA1|nr:hypothetical protein NERG_02488 [Nematocida ausubeli]
MLQEGSGNVSKIFLYRKIYKPAIKSYIMEFFMFGAVAKGVTPTNPLTRLTANILGSVPLNDPVTRRMLIFFSPILAGWRECYPNLGTCHQTIHLNIFLFGVTKNQCIFMIR